MHHPLVEFDWDFAFLNRETDQLKANQARQSVEDSKRLLSDKNFRNKQDRDRRLRELQSNNMKKFVDERKRQASRHEQESAILSKLAKEEEDALTEENKKVKSRMGVVVVLGFLWLLLLLCLIVCLVVRTTPITWINHWEKRGNNFI